MENEKQELKELRERLDKTRADMEDLKRYNEDLMAFLPVAYCCLSGPGKIIDANDTFEKLTGFGIDKAGGMLVENLFIETEKIAALLEESRRQGFVKNREFILLSGENKKIPATVSVSSRKDNKGNFVGFFLSINDITEFKNLQDELERKVEERTEELYKRLVDLERFRRLTEGREIKMIELKNIVRKLEEKTEEMKKRKK